VAVRGWAGGESRESKDTWKGRSGGSGPHRSWWKLRFPVPIVLPWLPWSVLHTGFRFPFKRKCSQVRVPERPQLAWVGACIVSKGLLLITCCLDWLRGWISFKLWSHKNINLML
jgi:hypothetical protein